MPKYKPSKAMLNLKAIIEKEFPNRKEKEIIYGDIVIAFIRFPYVHYKNVNLLLTEDEEIFLTKIYNNCLEHEKANRERTQQEEREKILNELEKLEVKDD